MINLFKFAGSGRGTNDAANKARELLLTTLYSTNDPDLLHLRDMWRQCLQSLCSDPYDDVVVKQQGGRSANYDFGISFRFQNQDIKVVHAEFKHNASRIDSLPEYFSPAADKPYLPRLYADAFYDSLDQICAVYPDITPHKPDRATYLRLVHNNDYGRHPFFQTLYDAETAGTKDQYKQKQQIVRDSIRTYLETYGDQLDLVELSKDIRQRQAGKVFLLWTLQDFRVDTIRDDEMEIVRVEGIKNGNTLVVVSKSGTKHNMLLRWKNHLGILYPAWQISLTR